MQALPSVFTLQFLTSKVDNTLEPIVSIHVLLHGYVLLQIFYQELDYRIQIHKVPYHLHLEETHIPY